MKNLLFITLILFVACGKVKVGVPGDKSAKPDRAINQPLRDGGKMSPPNYASAKIICGWLGQKNINFHRHYLAKNFNFKLSLVNCSGQDSSSDVVAMLDSRDANSPLAYLAGTSGKFYAQEDTHLHGPFNEICNKISIGDVVNDYIDINASTRDVYTFSGKVVRIERGSVGGSISFVVELNLETDGPFVGMIYSRQESTACSDGKTGAVFTQTITGKP